MREVVVLDVDNVVVKGYSQKLLLKYLFKKQLIGIFYYLRIYFWFIFYKIGLIRSPQNVMEYAFKFLKGKSIDDIDKIADDFFRNNLKSFIFQEVIDLINKHKESSRRIILLSNVIEVIVEKIANYLNIDDHAGTKFEIINGKYTGKIVGGIVYGDNKTVYLHNFIQNNNLDIKNSWAYGDHISDLDILKIVSKPFIVNPDRLLRNEAKKRNWPILIFKNTLRL